MKDPSADLKGFISWVKVASLLSDVCNKYRAKFYLDDFFNQK